MQECPKCYGQGGHSDYGIWEECHQCNGSGQIEDEVKVCSSCKGSGLGEMITTLKTKSTESGYYPNCPKCGGSGFE